MSARPGYQRAKLAGGFSWQKIILTLAIFSTFACASVARAAESSSEAQASYERGVEQFRAGNFSAACALLADSYRLEPLPGVLFTWATCELRAEHLANAATRYGEFLDIVSRLPTEERTAQEERRQVAQRERARILPEISFLTIAMSPEELRSSSVRRDGEPVAATSIGTEVAVEPGEHVIDFEGKGGARAQQRVVLQKGEHRTLVLGFARPSSQPVPREPARPPSEPVPPRPDGTSTRPNSWLYVTAGVGVAGLATGTVAGLLALRDKGVVSDECLAQACSARGKEAADAAKTEATVSTIGFGVGLAGAVATAILYFAQGDDPQARATEPKRWSVVALSPTAFGVAGSF